MARSVRFSSRSGGAQSGKMLTKPLVLEFSQIMHVM